jgi:hypothetical protein
MRAFSLLLITIAVAASVVVSSAPAAAQMGGSDVSGGTSVVKAKTEGSYSPPRIAAPTFQDLRLTFRLAIVRYFTARWLPATPFESVQADLPARRRTL